MATETIPSMNGASRNVVCPWAGVLSAAALSCNGFLSIGYSQQRNNEKTFQQRSRYNPRPLSVWMRIICTGLRLEQRFGSRGRDPSAQVLHVTRRANIPRPRSATCMGAHISGTRQCCPTQPYLTWRFRSVKIY